jgi:hypothetical protein
MMRLPKSISAWLPVAILGTTGTLLTTLALKSIGNTKGSYPAAVIATLQTEPAGSLLLILLLLFLVALVWVIYLHISGAPDPERLRSKFTKSKHGWMERDSIYFCTKCLAGDPPKIVRIVEEYSSGQARDIWLCPDRECRGVFLGPQYKKNNGEG